MSYLLNPDQTLPWNKLPELPIEPIFYQTVEIYEQLGNAKAALGRLQGRSIAIPNQGMLINSISLQEAKASSAIENIFTTDDELYKAYSEENQLDSIRSPEKEILNYREALWEGHEYLQNGNAIDIGHF
ncbi:Fic/DOC family N-terminal domain-containing protein [Algoriphagus antarcticus]|uniref:Fic/DOC family protein n=1 Tax=Algoriphagus antarcticus TaxID=238540 RepID=A0A3E0E1H4_9BACT|nr:Fic/DOC family N-terminal domain-containing protein [Algoriphagus antarcticus]REG92088.1 Fic/DOC family protein [Algoriphagus antarcticus]